MANLVYTNGVYRIYQIDAQYYPVRFDSDRVKVCSLGNDSPSRWERRVSCLTDEGIKYVASATPNLRAARARIYRQLKQFPEDTRPHNTWINEALKK